MEILKAQRVEVAGRQASQMAAELSAHFVVDSYSEQLGELFLIRNPRFRFNKDYQNELAQFLSERAGERKEGVWFYFPWNATLARFLPEDEHQELRTARNRNLITGEEQERYYNSVVGIAGLSVGSHAALTIAMTGGARKIKLADPDTVSVSNLNRLRYPATVAGKRKVDVAGQLICEINPYATVYMYPEGITAENIAVFVEGRDTEPRIGFMAEGVDNLEMKILLRERAKIARVPLVMATDNGDGIIVDVERYDLDPNLALFNGALGDISIEAFRSFPPSELPKLATKVAGPDYIVERMLQSLGEVGRTLYSWPQLGTAATFTGVATAYLARRILTGGNIASGKYDMNLESIFESGYNEPGVASSRDSARKKYLSALGL